MPKSKNRKNHLQKLNLYKANKKKEQELFKKKMIDNYIKMQEQAYAEQEAHTSTQDVTGPEIDIDDLNSIDIEDVDIDIEDIDIDIEDSTFEDVEEDDFIDVETVIDNVYEVSEVIEQK